jgi:hypothetical protein
MLSSSFDDPGKTSFFFLPTHEDDGVLTRTGRVSIIEHYPVTLNEFIRPLFQPAER